VPTSRSTIVITADRLAPIATRMPISCVRDRTVDAVTP
jgi:hypothetical protein